MKKSIIRVISLLICFVICCSFISCKKETEDDGTYYGRVQEIKEGSKFLVKDGASDYKILLPSEPVPAEEYAAS